MFEICDPAFTYINIPGNIPTEEAKKNFNIEIFVTPKKTLIIKKGKIGTTLKKKR